MEIHVISPQTRGPSLQHRSYVKELRNMGFALLQHIIHHPAAATLKEHCNDIPKTWDVGVLLQDSVHTLNQRPVYGTVPEKDTRSEYQGAEAVVVAPLSVVFINPLSAFCPPNLALQDW